MKNKILIVFLTILFLFVVVKTRELLILNNIHNSIENFKRENNRYYFTTIKKDNTERVNEIYLKNNLLKVIIKNNSLGEYCECKNLDTEEVYSYNFSNQTKFENEVEFQENMLIGLPNFFMNMYKNNRINISQLLGVYYILPTTYDNKACYKISTTSEIIIIDKETYLPLYSSSKIVNSNNGNDVTESIYKFEVNTVTDEDVQLPNLEEYEK